MKLTGKCKEEFLKHCKQSETFMDTYADVYLNALIIEFFDSVGIWNKVFFEVYEKRIGNYFESQIQAIEKANEIYNN